MRKILSLALILSLLLSCGVFASPDAVVPESADEALEEVSEIEENAELASSLDLINSDFTTMETATFNSSVKPDMRIGWKWSVAHTKNTGIVITRNTGNYSDFSGFKMPLEVGATYVIAVNAVATADCLFVANIGSLDLKTAQQVKLLEMKAGTSYNKIINYTVKESDFTNSFTASDLITDAGFYFGGEVGKNTITVKSLTVRKTSIIPKDTPYDLSQDESFKANVLPDNFGTIVSDPKLKITADVKDDAIQFTPASLWTYTGFSVKLVDGKSYKIHFEAEASKASNSFFVCLADGIGTNDFQIPFTGTSFTYDGVFKVDSTKFKSAVTSDTLLTKAGFGVGGGTAGVTYKIKAFSITMIDDAKKTFTADNENIFTDGGFENGNIEFYSVLNTTQPNYTVVSGDDNVTDGNYALKVTPGKDSKYINMGTNVEWQIDREYKYSFDIKVLNYSDGTAAGNTAKLYYLVNFPDTNATKGAQHSNYINSELPVGTWQHVEGTFGLSALESNSGNGIASDADLTDGTFAIWFAPVNNQNYDYIIDNISLVRLPYETDIDVSYDFDNTTRIFGAQWVHNNVDKRFGVGINDIKSEITADPINETNKVLKVTQNASYGALAFHMPLAENYTYTYSYDIYIADNTTNVATNFVFNDDLASGENQKTISHPQIVKGTVPANTWTHVEGSFTPVKTTAQSGQTHVADNVNLGENYFSIYAYDKNTFYIDNLVIKSYEPWNDEIAAKYAPTADTENFSVRADENSGIRTLASVTPEQKTACTEYGFIVALTSTLASNDNEELTFGAKSNYTYGVSYGTVDGKDINKNYGFKNGSIVFAAVFTGITAKNYDKALTFRPYLKLTYPNGGEKVVYGEAISKSVVDVVKSLDKPEIRAGMTEAQIKFCKDVVSSFGE